MSCHPKNFHEILVARCVELAGDPEWYPYEFWSVLNGMFVKCAKFEPVTRGKRKGQPNFRKQKPGTERYVVLLSDDKVMKECLDEQVE